jgi:hypothetical protein
MTAPASSVRGSASSGGGPRFGGFYEQLLDLG